MHHRLLGLILLLGLGACVQPAGRTTPKQPDLPRTEVFVLGMLHDRHLDSDTWGLEQVRATIEALDPDVICVEIPPDRWPAAQALWQAEQRIEDDRILQFPEYVQVLMPLSNEMGFEVEPCAAWTSWMAEDRKAKIDAFRMEEENAEAYAAYRADSTWTRTWAAATAPEVADDDPVYLHSPAFDLRTKSELGPYASHLTDVIGRPGGWTYINESHYTLIDTAIRKHAGKRILVTFGAGHKYWFLEQLRYRDDVELMDVRPYLATGVEYVASPESRARDAFLDGVDLLQVWWSIERGDSLLAWERLESRLQLEDQEDFLRRLRENKGRHEDEFLDGPFLGEIEFAGEIGPAWRLRAPVKRLGEEGPDTEWIEAVLLPDETRPGGFAWLELNLPDWLSTRESNSR